MKNGLYCENAFVILRVFLCSQLFFHAHHLLQGRLKVLDDLGADDVGRRKVIEVAEAVVLEPEDVQVQLVAFQQLVGREPAEALAFLPPGPVVRMVAGNEVVQVRTG